MFEHDIKLISPCDDEILSTILPIIYRNPESIKMSFTFKIASSATNLLFQIIFPVESKYIYTDIYNLEHVFLKTLLYNYFFNLHRRQQQQPLWVI